MASREPIPRYFFSRIPSEKKYSPGASVVAARREPIMTRGRGSVWGQPCLAVGMGSTRLPRRWTSPVEAPRARALAMWPTFWIPPSAMTGTPKRRAYSDTLYTAVAWGRPQASTVKRRRNRWVGGVGGDWQGALWPQLWPAAFGYTCTRTAAWLRTSHVWGGCTSVSNNTNSCGGHHSPVCTCTCAWPGQPPVHAVSSWERPRTWHQVGRVTAVSTRGPPFLPGKSGGRLRGKKRVLELVPELCPTAAVGRAGPTGERACPVSTLGTRGWVLSSPQNHGLSFSLPCPPRQHHKPRELQLQSTKQPGSGQLGRASGPGWTYYSSP